MTTPITIHLAAAGDLSLLVDFLAQPSIDRSFVRPLSERGRTINQRVDVIYRNGVWILAKDNQTITGCLGIYPTDRLRVEISTVAVAEEYHKRGIGTRMMEQALETVRERYAGCSTIWFDSWEGNTAMEKLAHKFGFEQVRAYEDPSKRPAGVKTVVYEKAFAIRAEPHAREQRAVA